MPDLMTRLREADPSARTADDLDPRSPEARSILVAAFHRPSQATARFVPHRRRRLFVTTTAGLATAGVGAALLFAAGGSTPVIEDARAAAVAAAEALSEARSGRIVMDRRTETEAGMVLSTEHSALRFDGPDGLVVATTRHREGLDRPLITARFGSSITDGAIAESADGRWNAVVDPPVEQNEATFLSRGYGGYAIVKAGAGIARVLVDARRQDAADGSTVVSGTLPHAVFTEPNADPAVEQFRTEFFPPLGDVVLELVIDRDGQLRKISGEFHHTYDQGGLAEPIKLDSVRETFAYDFSELGTPQKIVPPVAGAVLSDPGR